MVRAPCCEKMGLKRGPWTSEEDKILIGFIQSYGHSNWRALPKQAGLLRCGKSCRLRWTNYLSPNIKRGNFSNEEEETIIKLHEMLGNRWSAIAAKLPGRTDNEIKNVWNTHLKKRINKNDTTPKTKTKTSKGLKCETNEAKTVNVEAQPMTEKSSLVSIQSSTDSSDSDSSSSYTTSPREEHNESSDTKGKYNELSGDFFEFDESFWTAENLNIIADLPSPTCTESESESSVSPCSFNLDDGMDFWFDLYIEPKLTELF